MRETNRDARFTQKWHLAAVALGAALVLSFYCWATNLAAPFSDFWKGSGGVYGLLGQSLARGHTYLPVEPAPELLALANPYDPVLNRALRFHDAALFEKHYYLYHGPTPAILLFAPWYLIVGRDLPERLAVVSFCIGGYLFLVFGFARLLARRPERPPAFITFLLVLLLGFGGTVPFLLQRTAVYEVAIAGGFFFLSGGLFFWSEVLIRNRSKPVFAVLSGLCFGCAIGCRPHLGAAGLCAGVLLVVLRMRPTSRLLVKDSAVFFLASFSVCGLGVAAYNFARFGDPLEFGLRYQLGEDSYRNLSLSWDNLRAGFYHLLLSTPDWDPVFPFVRLMTRDPWGNPDLTPKRYFLEPIAGAIVLCPLLCAGIAGPFLRNFLRDSVVISIVELAAFAAAASFLFIAATGLASQRFEVDYAPMLLYASCIVIAFLFPSRHKFRWRIAAFVLIGILTFYSVLVSAALGIQGPYDQWVQTSASDYCGFSRLFDSRKENKLLLNPAMRAEAEFRFANPPSPYRQPLITCGRVGSRYTLSALSLGGNRVQLISALAPTSFNILTTNVLLQSAPSLVRIEFTPEQKLMTVFWNGEAVLQHHIGDLVTAPSQLRFGTDQTLWKREDFAGSYSIRTRSLSNP